MKNLLLRLFQALIIAPLRALKLRSVTDYADLLAVALWELKLLSAFGPVAMVSAPLFSGGTGDLSQNLRILEQYIASLSRTQIIWSQVPYLDMRVQKWAKRISFNTCHKIQEFYVPIIESPYLSQLICVGHLPSQMESYLESAGRFECSTRSESYADSLGCQTEREAAYRAMKEVIWHHDHTIHSNKKERRKK